MRGLRILTLVVGLGVALGAGAVVSQARAWPIMCTFFSSGVSCGHAVAAHPATLSEGADGRTVLLHLRWEHWGQSTAIASGVLREDTGPAGVHHYQYAPVGVTVSGLRQCARRWTYATVVIASPASGSATYHGCTPRLVSAFP